MSSSQGQESRANAIFCCLIVDSNNASNSSSVVQKWIWVYMIDSRSGRKQMMCSYCMSILCEWNVLTLPILYLALSMEFALAHASAGKRVGWKPLLCSHVSCLWCQRCRYPHSFHPAANITSREWLKVLASYLLLRFFVCAYEQFGRI
jgi:hypothetical protein